MYAQCCKVYMVIMFYVYETGQYAAGRLGLRAEKRKTRSIDKFKQNGCYAMYSVVC
jgi:hypothetical protein